MASKTAQPETASMPGQLAPFLPLEAMSKEDARAAGYFKCYTHQRYEPRAAFGELKTGFGGDCREAKATKNALSRHAKGQSARVYPVGVGMRKYALPTELKTVAHAKEAVGSREWKNAKPLSESWPFIRDGEEGLLAAIDAAIPKETPRDMRAEMAQELALGVLSGKIQIGDLRAAVPSARANYYRTYSDHYRMVSLSQPAAGDNARATVADGLVADASRDFATPLPTMRADARRALGWHTLNRIEQERTDGLLSAEILSLQEQGMDGAEAWAKATASVAVRLEGERVEQLARAKESLAQIYRETNAAGIEGVARMSQGERAGRTIGELDLLATIAILEGDEKAMALVSKVTINGDQEGVTPDKVELEQQWERARLEPPATELEDREWQTIHERNYFDDHGHDLTSEEIPTPAERFGGDGKQIGGERFLVNIKNADGVEDRYGVVASDAEQARREAWNLMARSEVNVASAQMEWGGQDNPQVDYIYSRDQGYELDRPPGITLNHERLASQQTLTASIPSGLAAETSALAVEYERLIRSVQTRIENSLAAQQAQGKGTQTEPINLGLGYAGVGSAVASGIHAEAIKRAEPSIEAARAKGLVVDHGTAGVTSSTAVEEGRLRRDEDLQQRSQEYRDGARHAREDELEKLGVDSDVAQLEAVEMELNPTVAQITTVVDEVPAVPEKSERQQIADQFREYAKTMDGITLEPAEKLMALRAAEAIERGETEVDLSLTYGTDLAPQAAYRHADALENLKELRALAADHGIKITEGQAKTLDSKISNVLAVVEKEEQSIRI